MKILLTAAAAAFTITGMQIADKQGDLIPDSVMPEASLSKEASWASIIEKSELFCALSFKSEAEKTDRDGC